MRDLTAVEMVGQRLCAAACLVASPDEPCTCSLCQGRWHGSMGRWRIPGTAKLRKPAPAAQPGPDLFEGRPVEELGALAGSRR